VTTLLFVHGGGDDAFEWDRNIVDRLQGSLGEDLPIALPRLKSLEALDWPGVKSELGNTLRALPPGAIVIAHSVGAAATIRLLADGLDPKLRHLFLLAPPYNGADGEWGDSAFAFPANFAKRVPKTLPITLFHSDDDDIIPVESAHRYAAKMPAAKVVILDGFGHQFTQPLTFLAKAIRGALV
jgi:pimeloyl-ACP methyl ester carboxylesterase